MTRLSSVQTLLLHNNLTRLSACPAAAPGVLEVVAAEPAGDVGDFADKVQARGFLGFKGFGAELVGVDAA